MAVKPLADILTSVNAIIGENTSDEALTLIEDITDSFNAKADDDNENWKKKYEELDQSWRNRYKERFLSGDTSIDKALEDDNDDESEEKPLTYESLFKEG